MGVLEGKIGKGCAMLTLKELIFICGCSYVCANFGKNRSIKKCDLESACRLKDRHTDRRKPAFIICRMLYAIALGQIIK